MDRLRSVILLLVCAAWLACSGSEDPAPAADPVGEGEPPRIYAVNYPLKYFAERIGGDLFQVEFPAPLDVDPAYWKPDADTILAYQAAAKILRNGAGYAKWIERASLPAARMVDTSAAFQDRLITIDNATTHTHGPEGEHSHGEIAFTTWLDPQLALSQAEAVLDALIELEPTEEAGLRERFAALERDLGRLDAALRTALAGQPTIRMIGSHPVYQYLARAYELDLPSVHFEPDAMPDTAAWRELEHSLEARPARWMLWEGTPLPDTAERLGQLGVSSVVYDPCGNTPEEGDFLSVMQGNVHRLTQAIGS